MRSGISLKTAKPEETLIHLGDADSIIGGKSRHASWPALPTQRHPGSFEELPWLAVDQRFQFLSRLKERNSLRRDLNRCATLWVSTLSGTAFADAKTAESAKLYLAIIFGRQRLGDAIEDAINDDLRVFLCKMNAGSDQFHEVSFRHGSCLLCI
jgi:hypothetical protein